MGGWIVPPGGNGAGLTVSQPYISSGGNLYLPADHMSLAHPPNVAGLTFLPATSTPTIVNSAPNGDLVLGDGSSVGPFFMCQTTPIGSTIEAVWSFLKGTSGSPQAGPYIWDITNSKIYRFQITAGSTTSNSQSVTYNGTAAPGAFTGVANCTVAPCDIYHVKLTVSGSSAAFSLSGNGGQYFQNLLNQSGIGASYQLGFYIQNAIVDLLTLNIA